MNKKTIVAIAAVLVVLGAGYAVARPQGGFWNGMMGGYGGMMGSYGQGSGTGFGMMGNGGMMGNYNMMDYGTGYGRGMMGYGTGYGGYCSDYYGESYGVNAAPITIEKAKEAVEQYLAASGNKDLQITEVMEFENNFYAGVKEKSTGTHAFELLINKYTGAVRPEMGPNMMWNTKYGYMAWYSPVSVAEKQALDIAQGYLDKALPGTKVSDVDAFYGYYTIEVTKDGTIYGMLSVNSYTGAVWYHSWHGAFVKILEAE